jgi:hypothetical protein
MVTGAAAEVGAAVLFFFSSMKFTAQLTFMSMAEREVRKVRAEETMALLARMEFI